MREGGRSKEKVLLCSLDVMLQSVCVRVRKVLSFSQMFWFLVILVTLDVPQNFLLRIARVVKYAAGLDSLLCRAVNFLAAGKIRNKRGKLRHPFSPLMLNWLLFFLFSLNFSFRFLSLASMISSENEEWWLQDNKKKQLRQIAWIVFETSFSFFIFLLISFSTVRRKKTTVKTIILSKCNHINFSWSQIPSFEFLCAVLRRASNLLLL